MINKKRIDMAAAIQSLCPNASWVYFDESDYDSLEWNSLDILKPTKEQIDNEIVRLKKEEDDLLRIELEKKTASQIAKQSALEKLEKLGLTEEEAKAIIGL
jgi:hypothetical protein